MFLLGLSSNLISPSMFTTPIPLFLFFLLIQTCLANNKTICPPSSCGNIPNISYPFRLVTDPSNCGHHSYTLYCENNSTILYLYSGKYYVKAINYNNFTIRIADVGVQQNDCSSFPRYSLNEQNFTHIDPYNPIMRLYNDGTVLSTSESVIILSCGKPIPWKYQLVYVDVGLCKNGTRLQDRSYLYYGDETGFVDEGCHVKQVVMMGKNDSYNYRFNMTPSTQFNNDMFFGFELYWYRIYCPNCGSRFCVFVKDRQFRCSGDRWLRTYENGCTDHDAIFGYSCSRDSKGTGNIIVAILNAIRDSKDIGYNIITNLNSLKEPKDTGQVIVAILKAITRSIPSISSIIGLVQAAKFVCGSPFIIGFLIYKWWRRHLSEYDIIEKFLEKNNNFMPIRYSYSEIKKITKNFKHKLGEGGYGSVYKGQLRSGHFAAIKMLGKAGGNGEDFVNEVATIGVIHHVNVVQLIGFCAEGSKRALVFDFMINGSLDKHIFSTEGSIPLSWTKLFDISLGVSRGIEYLHRGCGMQILHFDINPHNILLDENLTPKVSDFGLSKLSTTNQSIVSLTAARGTFGYMAPELVYKNIGNVSYKADVYSFGMLLLEMAGKRKIWKSVVAENSSQNYFPFLVHDQISNGNEIEFGCETEEENLIAKKMILVGLWCIQMQPDRRPSMKKVVEMLEGDMDSLEMPPKPLIYPENSVSRDETELASTIFSGATDSTSLIKSFDHEIEIAYL